METCFWWAPVNECVRRTASGLAMSLHATVSKHILFTLCAIILATLCSFKCSGCMIYTVSPLEALMVGSQCGITSRCDLVTG